MIVLYISLFEPSQPYINKKFNLFTAIFRTNICSFVYFSYSTPKLQSIEAQHPLPSSPCLGVIARTNESQVGFLVYINIMFNLFTAIYLTNICSYVYFSYSTPKLQSIEAQHPLPSSPCLGVIARTNESQVGFLPYINKVFNFFIAIFRTDICSSVYFSYSTPKL